MSKRKIDRNWISDLKKGVTEAFVAVQYQPTFNEELGITDIKGTIEKNVVYLVENVEGDPYRHHQYDIIEVSVDGRRDKTQKVVVLGTIDEGFLELAYNLDVIDRLTLDKYRFHGEFIVSNPDADKREAEGKNDKKPMKSMDGKDINEIIIDLDDVTEFIDPSPEGDKKPDDKDGKGQGKDKSDEKDGKDGSDGQDGQGGQKDDDGQGKDGKNGDKSDGQGQEGKGEAKSGGKGNDDGKEGSGAHGNEDVPKFETESRKRTIKTKTKFF